MPKWTPSHDFVKSMLRRYLLSTSLHSRGRHNAVSSLLNCSGLHKLCTPEACRCGDNFKKLCPVLCLDECWILLGIGSHFDRQGEPKIKPMNRNYHTRGYHKHRHGLVQILSASLVVSMQVLCQPISHWQIYGTFGHSPSSLSTTFSTSP